MDPTLRNPDFLPIMETNLIMLDKKLKPGVNLLRRLPETFSGPVRIRRTRRLWREWTPAKALLKGSSLLITHRTNPNLVIEAVDVTQVTHRPHKSGAVVLIRSSTGVDIRLRITENPHEWLAALHAVTRAQPRLSDFEVITPIGKGGGGEVYLVREKIGDQLPLAMKVVQKHNAFHSDGSLRHAMDERLVLELVRGFPFVVQLTHAFQTDKALYMVSDFYSGGDLKTVLRRQPNGRLSEKRAKKIMTQIILAIEHIHSLNCIYRDLKPENVLLTADGDVRICDFGLSKVLSTGRFGRTNSFCGSTSYMSPQIVSGKPYSIATDMWSMGSLFYRILVGRSPFEQPEKLGARNGSHDVHKRIQLDDPKFPSFLSPAAREMLEALLRKNEVDRMNLQDLKESLFFRDIDWDAVLEDGYDKASKPSGVLMGNETENFDPQRLLSHGVALEDKELHAKKKSQKKPQKIDGNNTSRRGFVSRHTSKLHSLSMRSDLNLHMQRKRSELSIVGFGYNYASDVSLIQSSDTDTSSSGRDVA